MDIFKIILLVTIIVDILTAAWARRRRDIYDEVWFMGLAILFTTAAAM